MVLKQQSTQAITATSAIVQTSAEAAELTQGAEVKGFEFKTCELSEKSVRVCMDVPSSSAPLLILLFLLPLLPLAYRVVTRSPEPCYQAKPRRIHINLCRFQE